MVKTLLKTYPETRNSDNLLVWKYAYVMGRTTLSNFISRGEFMKLPYETITRARRMIQNEYPELQATEGVRAKRAEKRRSKGTFTFREEMKAQYDNWGKGLVL